MNNEIEYDDIVTPKPKLVKTMVMLDENEYAALLAENTKLREALKYILSLTSKDSPRHSAVRDSILIEIIEGALK